MATGVSTHTHTEASHRAALTLLGCEVTSVCSTSDVATERPLEPQGDDDSWWCLSIRCVGVVLVVSMILEWRQSSALVGDMGPGSIFAAYTSLGDKETDTPGPARKVEAHPHHTHSATCLLCKRCEAFSPPLPAAPDLSLPCFLCVVVGVC